MREPILVGILTVLLMGTLGVSSATSSHGDNLWWGDCSIELRYPDYGTEWRYSIVDTFPGDKTQEGYTWSFYDRIADSANRWDGQLQALNPSFRMIENSGYNSPHIEIRYQDDGAPGTTLHHVNRLV